MKLPGPLFSSLILLCWGLAGLPARAADPAEKSPDGTVQAASFGMNPEAEDNTEALRSSLAACAHTPNPRLVLAAGVYRFKTACFGVDKVLAVVTDVTNLSIEGNGAQWLLTGDPSKVTGLRFSHCKNVRIANLSVDCQKLPFAQGTIISFEDSRKLVIEVDPRFPLQDDLPVESVVDCDAQTGLMLGNVDIYRSAIESVQKALDNRVVINVRMTVDVPNPDRIADLKKLETSLPGEKALLRQATYGGFMFTFLNSSEITMEDVTVHCFAGMAVHAQQSANLTLRRFVAAPPKDSGRLLSITKDAVHFTHVSGRVLLEDCHFDAVGDDAFNVYEKFRTVKKIVDRNHLDLIFPIAGWRGPTPEPGEVLDFWAADSMNWRGKAEVETAVWNAGAKTFGLTFRTTLPEGLSENDFVNSEKYLPKVEVRHSTFRGMLARAMVFSTYDVLVEDCRITGTSYTGMILPAGLRHGGQGPATRKLVIRNNVFEGTGGAAIYGYVYTKKPGTAAMGDITIEGNEFLVDARLDAQRLKTRRPEWLHWSAGICLLDASGVKISNNTFTGYPIPCYLGNVQDVTLTGNTSNQPSEAVVTGGSGAIRFDSNSKMTLERDQKPYDPGLYYVGIVR